MSIPVWIYNSLQTPCGSFNDSVDVLQYLSRNIIFMNHKINYCLFKNQQKLFKIFERYVGIAIL